ncbi:outer membrane OprD family porin [Pseudomonas duriflava]|uniref:Outer membrane OprD family porin n=1 Tax=Pseudomonas duriflava TaxID=459528 RepID=A0A562QDX3_9PSED|nr:OprD family porin [Pseudomonas duriflava]TWI54941.1 outer membrane OprD family porin [Pseudomonas duriflava]
MVKKPLALAIASACLSLSVFSSVHAAGFIEDSKATLSLRNFYINTDNRNGANNPSKYEEWGQGFMLNYQSGFTEGTVGVGVDALGMVGVRLDGGSRQGKSSAERQPSASGSFPRETDGSYVDNFSTLGLTAKARIAKTELRYGTLIPKLPVVTYNDGRLLPQTFEGGQITSKDIDQLTLTAGQIEHVKARGSSNNEELSIAGSNSGSTARDSNQFRFAGADYAVTKDLTLQYYFGQLENFYDQHFLGLGHSIKLGDGTFKTDLRYFNSQGSGNNKSSDDTGLYASTGYYSNGRTSGEVDNRLYSALFSYAIYGHTVAAGYQITNGDSDFPFLNQGDGSSAYINTDSQIAKFTRADEDTWQVRYAYDFATVGVPGLTAGVTYLSGDNAASSTGDKSEWERDISVAYVVPDGTFKGVGLTWKNAMYRSQFDGQRDQDENRLIVSYSIPLL